MVPIDLYEYTMVIVGQRTPDTYGRLRGWEEDDAVYAMLTNGFEMSPGEGSLVLEIQQRSMRFLVRCTELVLTIRNWRAWVSHFPWRKAFPMLPALTQTVPVSRLWSWRHHTASQIDITFCTCNPISMRNDAMLRTTCGRCGKIQPIFEIRSERQVSIARKPSPPEKGSAILCRRRSHFGGVFSVASYRMPMRISCSGT